MPLSYVENLASLLATCVEHPCAAGEVLNAIDPKPPRQWRYLRRLWPSERFVILPIPRAIYRVVTAAYEQIERVSGGTVSPPGFLVRYEMTPSFETFSYGTDKPRELLGWTPPVSPSEALRRTFGS
jgi:nucleoside-diphosphate-sugar epimerase